MRKKEKNLTTEDAALQNETVVENVAVETAEVTDGNESKKSDFKISAFGDDENRKSGVYIDKAEAEAFLEAQRKKKLRNRIITTVVTVAIVVLIVFIVYNVVFGGNKGFIKFSKNHITTNAVMAPGETISADAEDTLMHTVKAKDGTVRELWYSPKTTLLTVKVLDSDGNVLDTFRSWPKPKADEAAADDENKYANIDIHDTVTSMVNVRFSIKNLDGGNKTDSINRIKHSEEINKIENGFRIKYTILDTKYSNIEKGEFFDPCSFIVEFTLDSKGDLIVNVPREGLVEPAFDSAMEKNDSTADTRPRLASVTCLPFFGATRQGDSGYFVIPDGSGAITYFDESRIPTNDEYEKRIYGIDETFDASENGTPNLNNKSVMMPVYGIVGDNTMVTCFAEESEAHASLIVGVPGVRNTPFYYINYSFKWREYYYSKLSNSGETYTFLEVPSGAGDFKQRYTFSVCGDDEEFTYVDVANETREFLIDKWNYDVDIYDYLNGKINSVGDDGDEAELLNVKIFMSAVNKSSVSFLSEIKVMTTFKDAENIVTDMKNTLGNSRVKYSLLGWQNDGYFGNVMKKYNIEGDLGGKSGLKDLNEFAKKENVEIAADQNMLIVYGNPTGGASLRKSIVKTPGYEYLEYKMVSNAGTYISRDFYYMSPLYYDRDMLADDIKDLNKLGFANVDLQQLGELIYTDYNRENALLRQQALEYYRKWIAAYKDKFGEVSVNYGFDFAASVADNILNMPSYSSTLFQLDRSIPFAQIVYHGLVNYYSEPINRTSKNTYETLKAIEYGAYLTYEVTWNETEELKYTDYNSLFKSRYEDLRDQIDEGYALAEMALAGVENATITNHYCVDAVDGDKSGNVYCTEYSNGVKVYVNYGTNSYTFDDGNVITASGVGVVSDKGYESFTVTE